jgi:hypothetical protein
MGQLTRLQNELMEHQDSFRQLEEKMAGLSVMDTNTSTDEQQLLELMQHQGCYPSPSRLRKLDIEVNTKDEYHIFS